MVSKTILPAVIILPGNGGTDIHHDHWYAGVAQQLRSRGYVVTLENMPDAVLARRTIWLPHIKNNLHADENTIIIGHSSGGVAALRYLETEKLLGVVVIGVNHTDLGFDEEKQSGYYADPWQWKKIRENSKWIVQFCSTDDPYIPIAEPRFIHEKLQSEYHEYTNRGHFGSDKMSENFFPEIVTVIERHTNALKQRS
jgi:predicted alpha/beta hydrolase family esterase